MTRPAYFRLGDEPPLPPDWQWFDTYPNRAQHVSPVMPVGTEHGPRDVGVYFDTYESRNGSYELVVRVSCTHRPELLSAVAGICWALNTFVPMTTNRPSRCDEHCLSWWRRGLAGAWRWVRATWSWRRVG